MALVKEVVSFILLLLLTKFSVFGGRILNPYELENLDGRRSGINYEQKHIGVAIWEGPHYYAPEYYPFVGPFYPGPIPKTTPATTPKPSTTKLDVDSRNNFGDLPVKCGPNQEKIHGECQDV